MLGTDFRILDDPHLRNCGGFCAGPPPDEGEAQEKEAEAEAMDEEVTEDEARDADAKHSD